MSRGKRRTNAQDRVEVDCCWPRALPLASTGAIAQEAAPANTTAPAATAAADPAAAANATAPAAPAAAATPAVEAPALVQPESEWGQPIPKGIALPEQVSPNGKTALWLHDVILMPIIVVISLFVLGLLLWVSFRYRRKAHPVPSKTTHNTFIEVIWTVIPVLILVIIAVPSIGLLSAQYKPAPTDALTIKAIGNQWYWTYQYPDNGGFEITANMLKEQDQVGTGERFRTDAGRSAPARGRQSHRRSRRPADPPDHHLQRCDPQLGAARRLGQDRRGPRPDERDQFQDRPARRLFRPVQRAVRRPPRLYADRGRGGERGAVQPAGCCRRAARWAAPAPSAPAPTEQDAANTTDASPDATPAPADNVDRSRRHTTNQAATANPAGAGNVE